MPATEKTWRDQKLMHVVFGCTGLLMLIATVWMFAADHSREWKDYQRKMRSVDVRMTEWRMADEKARISQAEKTDLETKVLAAEAEAPPEALFNAFLTGIEDEGERKRLNELYQAAVKTDLPPDVRREHRAELIRVMDVAVKRAEFDEDDLLSQRKFQSADYDERRAQYDLAVRDGLQDRMQELDKQVIAEREARDALSLKYEAAKARRVQLQNTLSAINKTITKLNEDIVAKDAEFNRLASSLDEREATYFTSSVPFLGKKWLELPVLDAFNSPLKIDNLWTENLGITNGSFGTVTRFDRCTTCHKSIDKTAPGSAVDPLYPHQHEVVFELILPESAPQPVVDEEGNSEEPSLLSVYGIELASEGLISASDVTIRRVDPNSLAAFARLVSGQGESQDGLMVGDVITYVNQDKVLSSDQARRYLLDNAKWGQTAQIRVQRGLPHPYSSHPRLDLFVGSLSPHKLSVFGCSICHEGQGSATEFKWVSHSPNSPEQQKQWSREYGWFNNHHWIYPMYPDRFSESSCLKCHHEVVELALTDRFEEPPAPKLMKGYNLILDYGCYGCHEINGYNGPDKRIGPDMRLEPNYFAAAAQVKSDPNFKELDKEQKSWVDQLIYHPTRNHVRHELLSFLQNDFLSKEPVLTSVAHDQIVVLEDVETPGTLRKTGPSLRHIAEKVSSEWLYDWIKDPTSFRPSTKMPRFFGQWRHLDGQEKDLSKRYEPIEILGLVTYLLDESQPQTFLSAPSGMTESTAEEQVSRGRVLFETRGCLACHQHDDFPYATASQGPELSNIGNKFDLPGTPDAERWMYTWLKNPNLYHPRTKMPDLYLDVIEHPDGTKTDPASDIAMFLLNSKNDWAPEAGTADRLKLDEEGLKNLDGLLFEHLKAKMAVRDVEETIKNNKIPEHVMENITGAELLLSGEIDTNKKLEYIGYRTISKYGCYACHDIPGFEDAKPIGAALADWGRKDPSKLAFEHIAEYLHHAHGHGGHGGGHGGDDHGDHSHEPEGIQTVDEPEEGEDLAEHQRQLAFDAEFYSEKVNDHDRAGFIWQKLKEPRSYDYAKARNKDSFNDRLRMPMFPFNYKEREAVITFVLGLVSEPPSPEFVYQPSAEREAIISGTKVLEKFNCKGCHIMEPEQWSIEFAEGHFGPQGGNPNEAFPFMRPNFTTEEVEESLKVDKQRSLFHGHLVGMPTIDRDGVQVVYDEEGDPIEEDYEYDPQTLLYSFDLWEPTLLEGEAYQVGLNPLEIPASMITNHREALGGDLTKWLLPRVVEIARESDPQADGKQAYGWLPPPLNGEGQKVQSDWLHEFLLEPYTIRPATFMRMPKFNMSPKDATDLVSYFASRDNAVYPYEYTEWTEQNRLNRDNAEYEAIVAKLPEAERPPGDTRLEQAMNIITSNDYCVKCHIVADYDPGGSLLAKAPDLSTVNRRLRPNYLRHWIAKPTQILPYTPMPINIQFNADLPHYGGVSQQLFHGTSIDQVDAVVDLLMNYSRYSNSRANVAELVKPADTPEQGAAETTEAAANDTVPATGSAGE